jgi:beta-aspartyl-dipeptidase (metallo-type)
MFLLIKNAKVYSPSPLGRLDILCAGGIIVAITERIDAMALPGEVKVLDAAGAPVVPGLIDGHVHVTGGGGEGGYATRTPELLVSTCFKAGVTTVVGTLGTDGIARSMEGLVAKTYALREDGLSAWCFTGSYRVPLTTLTGDTIKDFMMVEPVIGVGELAISDHRSSLPGIAELARIASEARVAGMLSGKAGIVNFHIGDAPAALAPLEELVASGELPRTQFLPTHCNRSRRVFESALRWAKAGGRIDITTSSVPRAAEDGEVGAAGALARLAREGLSFDSVTCTSDGQGSLPRFDAEGKFAGLGVGTCASLWETAREAVIDEKLPLEEVLKTVTSSPSRCLGLRRKGRIETGADADLVILDGGDLRVRTVIARGEVALEDGSLLKKGRFEA